ncbi:MAG: hypothetical protein ACMUHM_01395 [Thermoplasmatota archaeon]
MMDVWLLLIIVVVSSASFFALVQILLVLRAILSPNRFSDRPLEQGNVKVPGKRSVKWRSGSRFTSELLRDWSSGEIPSWMEHGKGEAPRTLLAKLEARRDLEEVNKYIRSVHPWGVPGSTWLLNPKGDYDFTLMVLTAILFLYGDDEERLDPGTRSHLIEELLTAKGSRQKRTVPRTFGTVIETENHQLMIEGSRYLRAKWLADHPKDRASYRRSHSALERKVLKMLRVLRGCGFYEFNSDPYSPYSITALMNLEAFGSKEVSGEARHLLDRLFYQFASGSSDLRRVAPFRRQLSRAGVHNLDRDLLSAFMKVYISLHPKGTEIMTSGPRPEHSLMASVLPYRPPDEVMEMVLGPADEQCIRIGHGRHSSPEIYSKGPGYLLTAGGVHRGILSRIVSRPITLMLDDGAKNLREVVHISGPGNDFRKWNNTGVYKRFAVGAGPVKVPKGWKPVWWTKVWKVYKRNGINIGVHSTEMLGIIVVFDKSAEEAISLIDHLNHDVRSLGFTFEFPGGERIDYDVLAPRNRWVITAVGGQEVDRKFDRWPLLERIE